MRSVAAVVRAPGELTIEEIIVDPPKDGEVLVRMVAAGVCHSDLHTYLGELRATPPLVLGHEGAGVVEAVGEGVTRVAPGDHVMINWLAADETCPTCTRGDQHLCERFPATTFAGKLLDGTTRLHTDDGTDLKHYLASSTMAERMVYMEDSVIPIPDDVPSDIAAIAGCAVVTGVGSVTKVADVEAGSSAAVIGCGGIGLSMIQGCKLAECDTIAAIDVIDGKLDLAVRVGATHTFNSRQVDVREELTRLTRIGPDFVFDSVGSAATVSQALHLVRPGGKAVVAGLHSARGDIPIPAGPLVLQAKTLQGSFAGSMRPRIDLPRMIDLYRTGKLQLDELITHRYRLDRLPDAFDDMISGRGARSVIVFDDKE